MRSLRAALRFSAFFLFTFGIYGVWYLGAFFTSGHAGWRRRVFRCWSRGVVAISAMRLEVVGKPPQPPFLLVSNHLSYMDIAAVRSQLSHGVFVAKSEVKDWFPLGKVINDMQTIFIDRNNRRDILRAGAEMISKLNEGEGVIIFPEGTSTNGERVLPFNSSFLQFAAARSLPVSYLSINYRTRSGDPPASRSVCWWDDTPFLVHLWRLFKLKEFSARLNFGDHPILHNDRKKLAADLHHEVTARFTPVI